MAADPEPSTRRGVDAVLRLMAHATGTLVTGAIWNAIRLGKWWLRRTRPSRRAHRTMTAAASAGANLAAALPGSDAVAAAVQAEKSEVEAVTRRAGP